jgi:hypothetical protein
MSDIYIHYPHTDSSALNLPDLRARNEVAARGSFAACIARKISPIALESPTTMNQMGR